MTEEFDLDQWLSGATRTERSVTVYAKNHLFAQLDELEAELAVEQALDNDKTTQRAMGEGSRLAEVRAKIDALYQDLDASKLVLHIRALSADEIGATRDQVEADLKSEADAAAAKARDLARVQIKRQDIKDPADINRLIQGAASAAAESVISKEQTIRMVADALTKPVMTREQVTQMLDKIGTAQVNKLSATFYKAQGEMPELPKSLKPSITAQRSD